MDIGFKFVPYEYNDWDMTRRISKILHHESDFAPRTEDERLINFQVKLNPSTDGGVGSDGTGTLTVPSEKIGQKLLGYLFRNPIKIGKKKLKFFRKERSPPKFLALTLEKTPYIDPDIEEGRQNKLRALETKLKVDLVQFGIFYRPKYPSKDTEPLCPREFSIESEGYTGCLQFEYDHKLIRITLGDECTETTGFSLAITFSNIQKMAVGNDGKPYICLEILTPPVMESFDFNRTMTGNKEIDNRNFKQRISSLNDGHSVVAPYAQQLRLVLFPNKKFDTIQKFMDMCETVGIASSVILRCRGLNQIEAFKIGFFSCRRLYKLHLKLATFEWSLAFQFELLLHNGLLHTGDIEEILPRVEALCRDHSQVRVSELLRHYSKALQDRPARESPLRYLERVLKSYEWSTAFQFESLLHNGLLHTEDIEELLPRVEEVCRNRSAYSVDDLLKRYKKALQVHLPDESPLGCFERVLEDYEKSSPHSFCCCHVTFTPSRMILEGPYATKSNRIIRKYKGCEDHFIRVDFRDEDRLKYRWDREVDSTSFLQERVGATLKQGFVLAGRNFEFMAYSSSALREHAVWFMNPFKYPGKGRITADSIRRDIGDFEGKTLLKCPSKYAARLAQAFTATVPSVKINRNEWEEVPDLGKDPYFFTDGVGTISQKLADSIFMESNKGKRDSANGRIPIKPSAYQIRFLGYKGVVAVDEQLDKNPKGIQMRLRPSMKKFDKDDDNPEIEIAQDFRYPGTCYLNRPLVMLLEDVGVKKASFQDLQDLAIAEARTVDDSISQFNSVLRTHGLGTGYRLPWIMGRLQEHYDMDLKTQCNGPTISMDNPFFSQLRQVAMNKVLRDVKYSARIPVPESYHLVGVADEGPAYEKAGYENVFKLQESQIYACIQHAHDPEPKWLEGNVSISRSPVTHPGDVQRVRAIGKPPENMHCLFSHLKNVVVLPSVGTRSLASCLAGGDVDGDMFSVICHDPLLPTSFEDAADYESCEPYQLERDSTVEDICDFVVEYINSDVLGLLSDRLLVIADQSKEGMHDKDCIQIAELCSQAVDYPKQGIPVNLDDNRLPRPLIQCNPDWHANEVVSPGKSNYCYESNRALGLLFRDKKLNIDDPQPIARMPLAEPLSDPITLRLVERERHYLGDIIISSHSPELQKLFRRYADELRYICATHTLSDKPDVRLLEAEVVIGTILAECSQKRWRKDRVQRMRDHVSALVGDVQCNLVGCVDDGVLVAELHAGLQLAWGAWGLSLCWRDEFGADSFGLIALGTVFDCLEAIKSS